MWWVIAALLLYYTSGQLWRKITWYFAVDQFGYQAFANDLLRGRILHEWPPMDALAPLLPKRTDVLVQTYVWDDGRMYCRYAPGFPVLLAGWLRLFGSDHIHELNPTLFTAMVALLLAFQRRLFHSRWRAMVGATIFVLAPTTVHLWGLTLTRDVSAHLIALLGLFILLPWRASRLGAVRLGAAALAFGYTASIRPDGVMYLVPAALVATARWRREGVGLGAAGRLVAIAIVPFVVGLLPLLVVNYAANGNPLWPTQGMELQRLFGAAEPPAPVMVAQADTSDPRVGYPPGWHGNTHVQVQGGGLRLSYFPTTFPRNIETIRGAYGDVLVAVAIVGAVVTLFTRPLVFLVTVPYVLIALPFYSCWPRADTRYLIGMHVYITMLIVHGLFAPFDLVRLVARRRTEVARWVAGAAAGALLLGALLVPVGKEGTALPSLAWWTPVVVGAALAVAAVLPRRRIVAVAAPALALVLTTIVVQRAQEAMAKPPASFQKAQAERARANFQRAVEQKSVVITTEDVGRPAENIEYYSGNAWAFYLTDLKRWRVSLHFATSALIRGGFRPYLFIPKTDPGRDTMLAQLRGKKMQVDLVLDLPPAKAIEYFVAAPFHRGVPMELYRISSPLLEEALEAARKINARTP